ncbi:alpha/beta fold hydrolase [Roseococcus suduntuyensis]|uniref:Uncharacterized protein n=1 Tax=Roseococcus suduntuyensis TaxID=455361 RepID=A0A840ADS2_9PROT|nr:alpha/beta hydrolase [Roseococcus suduntuyensis]MBB3898696.1 hypothetical protein [Roseococcus suduntuyensis]
MAAIPQDERARLLARARQAHDGGDHAAALPLWDEALHRWPEHAGRDETLAFARLLLAFNTPRRPEDALVPPHAAGALARLHARWPEEPLGWIGLAKLAEWRLVWPEAMGHWQAVFERFDAVAEPGWYEQAMTVAWLAHAGPVFKALRASLRQRWPDHETWWDQRAYGRRGSAGGSPTPAGPPSLRDVENLLRFSTPSEAKRVLETLPALDRESATGRACAHIIRTLEHSGLLEDLEAGGAEPARPGTTLVWRNPAGGDRALIVFSGGARGYWLLLDELHRVLRGCGVHLIYLRGLGASFYMAGDPDLGIADYAGLLDLLRAQAAGLGATHLACLGNSAGGYAALRYALDLGAEGALAFSMLTNPQTRHDPQFAPAINAIAQRNPGLVFDLAQAYAAAARPPRTILCFGEGHETDRREAARMRGIPGVRLVAAEGLADHGAIRWFLRRGEVPGLVASLFEAPPA